MDRPFYECRDYDTGSELEDLKIFIKDLESYVNHLEEERTKPLILHDVMARASYNKHRGWDVFSKKVVKYAYVQEDGAVMRANGYCVGNYVAGDFLLHVP